MAFVIAMHRQAGSDLYRRADGRLVPMARVSEAERFDTMEAAQAALSRAKLDGSVDRDVRDRLKIVRRA